MTDEKKAEEYHLNNVTSDEVYYHAELSEKVRKAFLDGLAEGRKESCEVCEKESNKEYQKLFDKQREIITDLEAEIKQIIERERVVPEHYLIEMIEKIHCCQMCKHLQNNGSCLKADNEEVKKWGDFLIETRRKNFCKNWELVELNG